MKKPKEHKTLTATKCTFCKHVYAVKCDGRNDCPNAVWVRSKGTIDMAKMSLEQIKVFRKSGKQIPDVPPNVSKTRQREKLEEKPAKRSRIKL